MELEPWASAGKGKKGAFHSTDSSSSLSLFLWLLSLYAYIDNNGGEERRGERGMHTYLPPFSTPFFFFRPLLEEPGNAPSIMILINCVWEELKGEEERERE